MPAPHRTSLVSRLNRPAVFGATTCPDMRAGPQGAEHRRMDAFELWCWRRLWRVRWTARRSNQSILKEVSPEYSLEGPMLKLQSLAT